MGKNSLQLRGLSKHRKCADLFGSVRCVHHSCITVAAFPPAVAAVPCAVAPDVYPRTLWRWLPKHSIRHVRVGRTIRFRVADLRESVEARLVN